MQKLTTTLCLLLVTLLTSGCNSSFGKDLGQEFRYNMLAWDRPGSITHQLLVDLLKPVFKPVHCSYSKTQRCEVAGPHIEDTGTPEELALCRAAMDRASGRWDLNPVWEANVIKAKKSGLTEEKCRELFIVASGAGKLKVISATKSTDNGKVIPAVSAVKLSPLTEGKSQTLKSNWDVCFEAIRIEKIFGFEKWEVSWQSSPYSDEVKRRGFNPKSCLNIVEKSPPTER